MRIGIDAGLLGGRGGIAAYTEGLLAALARIAQNHSFVLWCARRPSGPAAHRMALANSTIVAPNPMGRFLDRLGRLAVSHPVPIDALVGPVDVFHGLNYLVPARRGGAALVVTVHDLSALRHPEWHPPSRALMHRAALPRTLRAAEQVITDSEAIRAELIAGLGVAPDRVTATHPAASRLFRPRPVGELVQVVGRWGLAPGGYLLFSGAIEPRKNILRLLEAVAHLRGRRQDLPPLILVGPRGWRHREIRARMAAAPATRYLGYVSPEELAGLMAGAAAFVFPSLYEGFGLPVLEAMASGVPVVTSQQGGALGETAGEAALLVDPLNPEAIAAGIERVLDDTPMRQELIGRGLARAAQFSWDRTARETLGVYEQAARRRG